MAVDAINGAGGAAATAAAKKPKDQLGQDAFLQLMVAQLKHQDPTEPVDPADFLGQLAQFGTVTGIQDMKSSIGSLSDALRSSQVLGGTNLVGHDVLVDADKATIDEGGEVLGTVTIPEGTRSASMVITDSSGQLVSKVALPPQQGEIAFQWDGSTVTGGKAPAGEYKIEVVADVAGATQQLATSLVARVGSVSIDPANSALTLNTDLGNVSLGRVRRVM